MTAPRGFTDAAAAGNALWGNGAVGVDPEQETGSAVTAPRGFTDAAAAGNTLRGNGAVGVDPELE